MKKVLIINLIFFSFFSFCQKKTNIKLIFQYEKQILVTNSQNELDSFINKNKIAFQSIAIYCHVESDDFTKELGLQRLTEIKNYFILKGINSNIISITFGIGTKKEAIQKLSYEEKQKSRIVEIFAKIDPCPSLGPIIAKVIKNPNEISEAVNNMPVGYNLNINGEHIQYKQRIKF